MLLASAVTRVVGHAAAVLSSAGPIRGCGYGQPAVQHHTLRRLAIRSMVLVAMLVATVGSVQGLSGWSVHDYDRIYVVDQASIHAYDDPRNLVGEVRPLSPSVPAARVGTRTGDDLDAASLSRPDLIGSPGRGPDVRVIDGDAADTYARLAHGADDFPHPTYAGPRARLDDGTVIGLRESDKYGLTLDVNPASGVATISISGQENDGLSPPRR